MIDPEQLPEADCFWTNKENMYLRFSQLLTRYASIIAWDTGGKKIRASWQALLGKAPKKGTNSRWDLQFPNRIPAGIMLNRSGSSYKVKTDAVCRFDSVGAVRGKLPDALIRMQPRE